MQVLERDIERRFCDAMKRRGVVVVKLNLQGNRGWPDRMVILPNSCVQFIEFKRPGEALRPLQIHNHAQLAMLGHIVATCDNVGDAVDLIDEILNRGLDRAIVENLSR